MEPAETEKGDEYIVLWSKICKEKIDEAYDEFIKKNKYFIFGFHLWRKGQ